MGSPVLSTYFIVLVMVCGVAFVVSTVVYMNRELRRKERGEPEFPDITEDRAMTAVLRGVGGCFSGKELGLLSGPVVFGRDGSKCTAVYPQNTKGISGVHCKAELRGQGVLLTDLGSTYGTFLQNGQKLTPQNGVSLHTGERFYLAEQTNMFEIR